MHLPLYPIEESRRFNRRSFIAASASLAVAAVWSSCASGPFVRRPKFADYPFQLGVASGDPDDTSVVLWTRLAPKPLEGGGMPHAPVLVSWQVAEDEPMKRIVRRGTAIASPEWGHSIHIEVPGLPPDRWYCYQFKAGSDVSPKGRTRTMPAADAAADRLRLAFASCQHFEAGHFTAYDHMLREHPDLVLHLGDYIYEGAARDQQIRKHVGPELHSLEEYRNRHAQYKTDPHLQAMHGGAPWLVTWDDHEVDNNCAGPISEEKHVRPDDFLRRRARAYQAYYEHMPLRRRSLPHGPDMLLYRNISFGRLAQFYVLDTRQYRTDQPCGDGNKPPCDGAYDPKATLLGIDQKRWLHHHLERSPAQWNVLAQQIMMARVDRVPGDVVAHSMDQWPGYEIERREMLQFFRDRQVSNPVVLAGDIHTNWANELATEPANDPEPRAVATEFVGTSISSGGDGTAQPNHLEKLLAENPFVKFHNAERGYVLCEVSPAGWTTHYRTVDYVTRPGAPVRTRASFHVESGHPKLLRA